MGFGPGPEILYFIKASGDSYQANLTADVLRANDLSRGLFVPALNVLAFPHC